MKAKLIIVVIILLICSCSYSRYKYNNKRQRWENMRDTTDNYKGRQPSKIY